VTRALAIAALVAGCSVSHRSGDYACTSTAECATGRSCIDGFCVLNGSIDAPGNPHRDAPKVQPDAPEQCPTGCTSCNVAAKTCTIDCSAASSNGCASQVTCPTGYNCTILCNVANACKSGVDCTLSSQCAITCSGQGSCRTVECGIGPCDVMCSGGNSCRGVACNSSCACDVTCTGNLACSEGIQCTSSACISGLGCTSVPAFCHSCM